MSAREWQDIHRAPRHYVVAEHHDDAEREVVVSKQERYWIVQRFGSGAQIAGGAERGVDDKVEPV